MPRLSDPPLHRRAYQAFLSHAHADKRIVDRIHAWLTDVAGVPVWYDATQLPASSRIVSALGDGICESRAVILVLSQASVGSGWVQEEYNAAVDQRASNPDFRIIPIRLDDAEIPAFLQTTKWIELPDGVLRVREGDELLASLYGNSDSHRPDASRDLYVSRTWREAEASAADEVCRLVAEEGFRLIGDSKDQHGFADGERVRSIIASCGAFVAVLPDRGDGTTSEYMLREIEHAHDLGLPCLIVADPAVRLPDECVAHSVRFGADRSEANMHGVRRGIQRIDDEWERPSAPHRVFFSTPLDDARKERTRRIKNVLERVTAMPCVIGDDIREGHVQRAIVDAIHDAFLVIADISDENLNTAIEAGIALGAGRNLHLVAAAPRRRPAFMFRDQQVWYYDDDVELLGLAHRIARPYRRRVLNDELVRR